MNERVVTVRMGIVGALVLAGVVVWLPILSEAQNRQPRGAPGSEPQLAVHFLDVGQGDATLIETPDGTQVLIDGGPNNAVLRALGEVMAPTDRSIDVVIATHPDSDHIGGLVEVLARYEVGAVIRSGNENDTPTTAALAEVIAAEAPQRITARAGQTLSLGASTTLSILFPVGDARELATNAASVVAKLSYNESDVLLTGDAPASIEEFLVDRYGPQLQSEVLKVGHHGSDTSTSEEFVAAVLPELSVISAGADNPYGHPHQEVLETLSGTEILGTYEDGTITLTSSGDGVWRQE